MLPKSLPSFIWHFLRPYWLIVIVLIFLTVAAGFWGPLNNLLIKQIVNLLPQLQDGNVTPLFLPASLVVVNFIVFDNVTWRLIGYINYKYQGVIKNKILKETFEYILGASHQFFQDHLSGRIVSQITTLADHIELIVHRISFDLIRGSSLLIVSFCVSFGVNPTFFCVLIVWFICFASFSIWMSTRFIHLADQHAENESLVADQIVDTISSQSNVRIFSQTAFELARMDDYLKPLLEAFKKKEGFVVVLDVVQGAMIAAMMGLNVYFLVHLYDMGQVSIGDFALILGLSMELGHMMWFTMSRVDDFYQAYGKCKQSLSALMVSLDIQDKPDAKPLVVHKGQIVFNNVQFHYRDMKPLFLDQSIDIQALTKVGLVGYSGGGKSTFVNLVLRLYDVTGGSICIDGQNIRDVMQDSLRKNIAMIPQDPFLFHRSLMDNMRYGRMDATDAEVMEASKKAHAHEFITKLPQGYASLVGERGVKLSGGQRQRIAIARAILKNAPILILDEATSQLDSVTEGFIQESLAELMHEKTAIVVAHRLSTLLHMDRILVFDKGNIVEDGTHHELLAKAGLYRQLWNAQVGGFIGDKKQDAEI